MKYRNSPFLLALLIAGCSAVPAIPTATRTVTVLPEPTLTPALTSTAAPLPTAIFIATTGPLPAGRELIFEKSGNREWAGTAYGEGDIAIILANMVSGGEAQWSPFVAAVDTQLFTTITFNYRSSNAADQDTRFIVEKLREWGYQRMICMGASLGTTACSRIAQEPEMAGIVLIAGRMLRSSLSEAVYPKLFISGALDPVAPDIQMGYEQAAEPRELVLFEENRAHGTNLFSSEDGEEFLTLLIDFVNSVANP